MHASSTDLNTRPATTAKPRPVPMSRPAAIKLVDLLATSDEFRDEFMHDARTALESWHFDQHTIDFFWFDCKIGITRLASKETIASAREEILAMLAAGFDQTTPQLDAGLNGRRTLK